MKRVLPIRTSLGLGIAALAIGVFIKLTREVLEHEVDSLDTAILQRFARARNPWLNAAMLDLTSMGSPTLITLFSLIAFLAFALSRRWLVALQVAAASVGSLFWIVLIKGLVERVRPQSVPRLTEVGGYSYPSGHSLSAAALYLTLALLASKHARSHGARTALIVGALGLISAVATSRVYLGVHYPSDVASGVCLGLGWALLLDGGLSTFQLRSLDG